MKIICQSIRDHETKELIEVVEQEVKEYIFAYAYASVETIDYLRFNGYALDWMGLSVQEMIDAGWAKLDES